MKTSAALKLRARIGAIRATLDDLERLIDQMEGGARVAQLGKFARVRRIDANRKGGDKARGGKSKQKGRPMSAKKTVTKAAAKAPAKVARKVVRKAAKRR